MARISIVIPAFNEANRILPTLRDVVKCKEKSTHNIDILVVDDGSTDGTAKVVNDLKTETDCLQLISLAKNGGKGFAVKTGMLQAVGEIIVFMDADGSTPISELERVIEPILNQKTDIAIGSRYEDESEIIVKQPLYRTIWSRSANWIVQRFILPGIKDPICGFKAFKATVAKEVFLKVNTKEWSFDLEALAIAQKLNYSILEVPVQWTNDEDTKVKKRHLFKELYNSFKIYRAIQQLDSITK